eukprot:CAMPEP_0201488682 /NCGR_PEP_ID=MMETSP0151_2-20130828/19312_1 /ASSEMBLY_ACC=CAM_ASM_000257 /TAXON_ID=200890 /ORGANISM="Paramoeba atlantica, Strain 621/1 / CCAP 1560/9" /LENGTH=333 /DNA_ID=CAMNT_0047874027 /DNA_START=83 /DNA_END=1084 /DNA_ORIENTATION=+
MRSLICSLLFVATVLLLVVDNVRAIEDQTEQYLILSDLYFSTNGPGWTDKTGWLTDLPCNSAGDNWYGVTCDPFDNVTELHLGFNELDGTLPSSLSDLPFLTALLMNQNQLNGTIPDSFASWDSIEFLQIGDNALNGAIPSFDSPMLQNIDLFSNDLSGTIPTSFDQLNLLTVDLSDNLLTGSVPLLVSSDDLQSVNLFSNQLTGSIPRYDSTTLQTVMLGSNALTGTLPNYSGFKDLNVFEVQDNSLTGKIRGWICNPRKVDLTGNDFSCSDRPKCCHKDDSIKCGGSCSSFFMPIWAFVLLVVGVVALLAVLGLVIYKWRSSSSRDGYETY